MHSVVYATALKKDLIEFRREMDEAYMTAKDELDDDAPKMGKGPDNSEIMSVFSAASAGKKKAAG